MNRYLTILFCCMLPMASPWAQTSGAAPSHDRATAHSITLANKWSAQAQFAGFYVALDKGFFREENLDVKIIHPTHSGNSFTYLNNGQAQVAITNLSHGLLEVLSGQPLVNIMQTSQQNSLYFVSRKPLPDIAALRGRKVSIWNHLTENMTKRFVDYFGLQSTQWLRFNEGVNVFMAGAADPCMVGSYNEVFQLEENGLDMSQLHLLSLGAHGYNLPEEGLYVKRDYYETHTDDLKRFVKASIRGWQSAAEHEEETLDIVMKWVQENRVATNRYHQRRMLREILRLQQDARGKRTYKLSRESYQLALKILGGPYDKPTTYEDFVK